jgi:hypothetical protein
VACSVLFQIWSEELMATVGTYGATVAIRNKQFKPLLALSLFATLMAVGVGASAQSDRHELFFEIKSLVESPAGEISGSQLLAELAAHDQIRNAALLAYTELRTYQLTDAGGKVRAQQSGQMEFRAPGKLTFVSNSEAGSGIVRRLAFNPLIASEIEAASGKTLEESAITPANYTFEILGEEYVGPNRCFVAWASPKRPDKYLFEGKVWIDAEEFAIVRVSGHPARKLSFWIDQANFVREFQRIDGFWLPQKDQSFVQVKIYGKKVLTIEHQYYAVSGGRNTEEPAQYVNN